MSQQEFELYLSLLGRFLRLNAAQRSEIADELRDHLEERLDELKSQGLSHEEAISRALHEFGDASELATHFTQLAISRRRRMIMRRMLAPAGAATAVILLMWGLMRVPEPQLNPNVVAQQDAVDDAIPAAQQPQPEPGMRIQTDDLVIHGLDLKVPEVDPIHSDIEQKLARPVEKLDLIEIPLRDALNFIGKQIEVDVLYDHQSLESEGVALDDPVTLHLEYAQLKASTAIELILERVAGDMVKYTVRDGFIYIQLTSKSRENMTIEIYNVRDLLEGVMSTMRYDPETAPPGAMGRAMAGAGAMGRSSPSHGEVRDIAPVEALIRVIVAATDDAWAQNGTGKGTIEEFDGLLVIRQSEDLHREIKKLLEMLRETKEGIAAKMKDAQQEFERNLPSY